jgi:hypothetical protein
MTNGRCTRRGEDAPNAKLTRAQALEYRRRYRESRPRPTIAALAAEASVSWTTMQGIVSGRSYREEETG